MIVERKNEGEYRKGASQGKVAKWFSWWLVRRKCSEVVWNWGRRHVLGIFFFLMLKCLLYFLNVDVLFCDWSISNFFLFHALLRGVLHLWCHVIKTYSIGTCFEQDRCSIGTTLNWGVQVKYADNFRWSWMT